MYLEKISIKDRAVEDLRMSTVNLENQLSDALVENGAINNRMLIATNDELRLQIEALEAVNKSLRGNTDEYKLTITGLEEDKQRLTEKLQEVNLAAEKKAEEFNVMQKEILSVRLQLEQTQEREKVLTEEVEVMQQEISKLEIENSNLRNSLEGEKEKFERMSLDYNRSLEVVKELTEIRVENETQIRKDKQAYLSLPNNHLFMNIHYRNEVLKKELMTRERAIEDVSMQRDLAYQQIDELKTLVVDLESTISQLRDERHAQETDFESKDEHLRRALEKEKEQKDEWFQRFKGLQSDLAKRSQEILGLQNQILLEKQSKAAVEMKVGQLKEVIEQNEERCKELRNKLEESTYALNGVKRDYASLEELNKKILADKAKEISKVKKECEDKIRIIEKGVHPMLVEDMWSRTAETYQRAKNAEYKLISTQIENEDLHKENESLRNYVKNLNEQLSAAVASVEALKEEIKEGSYKQIKDVQEIQVLREKIEIYQKQSVEAQHKHKEVLQEIADKNREIVELAQEVERINYEFNVLYNKYCELKIKKRHRSRERSKEGRRSKEKRQADEAARMSEEWRRQEQPKSETNLDKADEFPETRGTRQRANTGSLPRPTKFNDERKRSGDSLDRSPERTNSRGKEASRSREYTTFERIPEKVKEGSSVWLFFNEFTNGNLI